METPAIPDMESRVSKISTARTELDRDGLAALLVSLIREVPNFPEPGIHSPRGLAWADALLSAC